MFIQPQSRILYLLDAHKFFLSLFFFVFCRPDLYIWAQILQWSNIAGHMLDSFFSQLYPHLCLTVYFYCFSLLILISCGSLIHSMFTSAIYWCRKVLLLISSLLFANPRSLSFHGRLHLWRFYFFCFLKLLNVVTYMILYSTF